MVGEWQHWTLVTRQVQLQWGSWADLQTQSDGLSRLLGYSPPLVNCIPWIISGVCCFKSCWGSIGTAFTQGHLWKQSKNETFTDFKWVGFQFSVLAVCGFKSSCDPVTVVDPFGAHIHSEHGVYICKADGQKDSYANIVKSFQKLFSKTIIFFLF